MGAGHRAGRRRHRPRARARAVVGTLALGLIVSLTGTPGAASAAGEAAAGPRPGPHAAPRQAAQQQDLEWVGSGAFRKVYDTGAETPSRYLNDHAVIQGPDGVWHMYGITGATPPPGGAPDSAREDTLAHATAPGLSGPWTTRQPVLTTDPAYGEDHLWAPHVIEHDGTYYMFYSGGGGTRSAAVNLATSTDLWNWTRLPSGPLFRDGWVARDPFVLRDGDRWIMYYTATATPDGGNHVVAYRTSTNLIHWSGRRTAFTDPTTLAGSAPVTESPFVVHRGGWWYLFTGPRGGGYTGTDVYRSRDPEHFALADYAGHFPAHAPEIVRDGDRWYATHSGWFQGGLHLAPLHWRATPPPWRQGRNPVVAAGRDGRLEAFALQPDGTGVLHRAQDAPNGTWGAWEPFGEGSVLPGVGRQADGRLELYGLADDGVTLLHRIQQAPGGAWGPWEPFGGTAGAAPAVGRNADGRLELFAVAPGGSALLHRWQTAPNGGWSDWAPFGGPAGGAPVVASNADGRLEVFALAPGGASIQHRWQTAPNGGWSDWARFGGPASGPLTVAANADGRLEVFALAPYGDAINHRWQTAPSGGWSDWARFGTRAGAAPTVARNADGRLEVFAVGPGDDYVAHRRQTAPSGGWGAWEVVGGPAGCTPSPALEADGRMSVFALHPGGEGVSRRTQRTPGGGWDAWQVWTGTPVFSVCGSAS